MGSEVIGVDESRFTDFEERVKNSGAVVNQVLGDPRRAKSKILLLGVKHLIVVEEI